MTAKKRNPVQPVAKKRNPVRQPVNASNADDPLYRIAYDVDRCKVGCVLIQVALGCDVPNTLFFEYFGTGDTWTLIPHDCQVYPIRRSQLPLLAARTNVIRKTPR